MKIAIGCDHGGIDLKETVIKVIEELGHQVDDQGCHNFDSVDYPDFAKSVCAKVQAEQCERGILLCGTGIGMSMVANKFTGIRAALCQEIFAARMSREHNDANVLCMGSRIVGSGLASEVVRAWLTTEFAGGRHQRRLDMF